MWLENCNFGFRGVTHEWMSYILEMLFLFWLVVMSLISQWDNRYVCVKLLADDEWASEVDKTGFLIIGMGISHRLYLKERPISLPVVQSSTIKRQDGKWG